ncbi:efflux RND transporter permease subunit [Cupriavidus numazuensis]|uniref:Efflux pump membrane transporter n=1 Tax=Cupriavidus numazuensis TaxID=221992 RepID=A0ABM8TWU7_9BURK|nr:multidrug efflux RND transporter permease subunit [Cupriavidus numazuensis]CAG2161223.1 multidrug efflux RND transporter permease subunit OqxB12 [Cupriavidus numazuensis]
MNFSKFFVDRPNFAAVISIVIFLAGLIAMPQLPISEYPEVVPPSVVVRAQFPGANPKVIAETVATPLEEQINGVEDMLYMSSQAASDGVLTLTVTFKLGTDPNLATQLVQNRVNEALPRLPDVTRQLGVSTVKSSPDLTMVVHLVSPSDRYDMLYLRNYAQLNVKDELAKIPGIGQIKLFGSGNYAMRIWLNPQKIAERNMNPDEVVAAIRKQNIQVAAGVVGGPPYKDNVEIQLPVNVQGRLTDVDQFENIIIKREAGVVTYLKDVARVEMGANDYALRALLDNKQALALVIFQTPGANAIEISNSVRAKMAELNKRFPDGLEYRIAYDPTTFVRDSIKAVIHTLLEAIVLVVLVVIVFLQTWRAAIIPLVAVPVSVIGTFAVMHGFGFSINALSLFGLVLAIGIVVDDAIVVVENVERNIATGLKPREATIKAMQEVTGPIIAIALVLCAVFVPIAFISGLTGQFYRQFALTIAISTVISAFNSLTLSPALAALLLRPHDAPKDWFTRQMDRWLGGFFARFNRAFGASGESYGRGVQRVLKHKRSSMVFYVALLAATVLGFVKVPAGFVPLQDKGYLVNLVQLPNGATLNRSESVVHQMADVASRSPGVGSVVQFPGLSLNGFINNPSSAVVFLGEQSFEDLHKSGMSGPGIAASLQKQFGSIRDAIIAVFPPPPVQGLGNTGGFKLQIEDRGDAGYLALSRVVKTVLEKARKAPELVGVYTNYNVSSPQIFADVDRTRAAQLGVDVDDVFRTMQIYLGSLYVNDFNKFGRTYQVIAQGDREYRSTREDILGLKVRNVEGKMVPLGALVTLSDTSGPDSASRYNGYRSADISGRPAPGYSSGQAQEAITRILKETLPADMVFEWTELAYQQILAGNTALIVFPICILLVFLVLTAQYESPFVPLAIILIVPMCLFSAIAGVWLTGGENNLFTQIGFFVLIGLACKNAILICEFARELEIHGKSTLAAAVEAAHLRLRPILMTSIAFIMGVVPLVVSHGAGAEMRHAMGVAVFFGMIGVTFFGLFLTPVFYVLIRNIEKRIARKEKVRNYVEA